MRDIRTTQFFSVGLGGVDITALAARGEALVNTSIGLGGVGRADHDLTEDMSQEGEGNLELSGPPINCNLHKRWNSVARTFFFLRFSSPTA